MASLPRLESAHSHAKAIEIRVCRRPVYRVASWAPTAEAWQPLADNGPDRLPGKAGTSIAVSASRRALCIGPGDWLLVGGDQGQSMTDVRSLVVVELTDAVGCLQLRGGAVEQVLASMCGLDMEQTVFTADTCARTRFAGIALVLDRYRADEFACYVPRSYLSYLFAALREAAHMRSLGLLTGFSRESTGRRQWTDL